MYVCVIIYKNFLFEETLFRQNEFFPMYKINEQ